MTKVGEVEHSPRVKVERLFLDKGEVYTSSEVSELTGVPLDLASYHVKKCKERGIALSYDAGYNKIYYGHPDAISKLVKRLTRE